MTNFSDLFQSADWKEEKHVPVIEGPDTVKKGELTNFTATVGKEIPHPNTTEHHIRWIAVYFLPTGGKFPFQLGHFEFTAHGESTEGPNQGPVYTEPRVSFSFKTNQPGTIFVTSYCNIHGLWKGEKEIKVE